VNRRKIVEILVELLRKGVIPRKRVLPSNQAYPSREKFTDKAALKKLGFLAQTKIYLFWKQKPQ